MEHIANALSRCHRMPHYFHSKQRARTGEAMCNCATFFPAHHRGRRSSELVAKAQSSTRLRANGYQATSSTNLPRPSLRSTQDTHYFRVHICCGEFTQDCGRLQESLQSASCTERCLCEQPTHSWSKTLEEMEGPSVAVIPAVAVDAAYAQHAS